MPPSGNVAAGLQRFQDSYAPIWGSSFFEGRRRVARSLDAAEPGQAGYQIALASSANAAAKRCAGRASTASS